MTDALFHHIPRCLFEPVAVVALAGIILFLFRLWKKDRAQSLLFALAILFLIAWRLAMPINADRYALFLIPPAIFFCVTFAREAAALFRRIRPLPWEFLLLSVLLIACTVKSFHCDREDTEMFSMIRTLKQTTGTEQKIRVVSNRDISCFLDDRFQVQMINLYHSFRFSELPPADYYLLKMNRNKHLLDTPEPSVRMIHSVSLAGPRKTAFVLWKREKKEGGK